MDVGAFYDGFAAVGLQYGPGYRTLLHPMHGSSTAVARLQFRGAQQQDLQVHPADLDDALCITSLCFSFTGMGLKSETRVPFSVDDALLQDASGEQWAVRCI